MKKYYYFYNLNGLMIRFNTYNTWLWISYGHSAEWQFVLSKSWWWTWPKSSHRFAIWGLGFIQFTHVRG